VTYRSALASDSEDRRLKLAACVTIVVWLIYGTNFSNIQPVAVPAVLVALTLGALLLAGRKVPGWVVLLVAVSTGIALRLNAAPFRGSDVLAVTAEAIGMIAHGIDPYAQHFAHSNPPGGVFPYLPGEPALYAIQNAVFGNLAEHDRWWGVLVLLLFAALAPVAGSARAAFAVALYGTCSSTISLSVDGSNDTALFFLVILAVVLLSYAASVREGVGAVRLLWIASAAVFGWALAFKAFAWFAFVFAVWWIPRQQRRLYAAVALGVALLFCVWFIAIDPSAFFLGIATGQGVHEDVAGFNVWTMLEAYLPIHLVWMGSRASEFVDVALVLGTGCFVWARTRHTLGDALARSAVVLMVALLFARWTSVAYFNYLLGVVALAIATSTLWDRLESAAPVHAGAKVLEAGIHQKRRHS
jgi:hypothetical protein